MRWCGMLAVCLVCGLVVGCQENQQESQANRNVDVELVNSLNNRGVENAIVAQHTLFPYHFVLNSEEFNELGHRDLVVLARHFREHEGTLNVRRGDVAPELYEARITYVIQELKNAGVDTGRMSISDGMPGGDGMPSERVVSIMARSSKARSSTGGKTSYSGMTTK